MSQLRDRFPDVTSDAKGHFALYYYTAVAHLIDFVLRQAKGAGADAEALYSRYGFLRRYHELILAPIPDDETMAGPWWRQALREWSTTCDSFLPATAICNAAQLNEDAYLAFLLFGLAEEDARFGGLFADLQAPMNQRRPTLELIGEILSLSRSADKPFDPWSVCQSLLKAGLVQVQNNHVSRPEWIMRVPSVVWDAARGDVTSDVGPLGQRYIADEFLQLDSLIYPGTFIDQLKRAAGLSPDATSLTLTLRAGPGDDVVEIAGALARHRGMDLLVVDAGAIDAEQQQLLGPVCTLIGAMPLVRYEPTPGHLSRAVVLKGYRQLYCQSLGHSGGVEESEDSNSVVIEIPRLDRNMRVRHWQCALGENAPIELLAERFQFGVRQIKDVAKVSRNLAALENRDQVDIADVRHANRQHCRQRLETLADHLETNGTWSDLVCNVSTSDQLAELQRRCMYRESLSDHVEFVDSGLGVCALLAGPSGTGKTMASKILASELGMDIYRLNLSGVVNKFLGETEKNLHRVFTQAEASDVILLLDEGDALLGSRTDVKSSNDRYANLETNFLLQQLEQFNGIVIITSNRPDNIDTAFQRRMDAVVYFSRPQTADERLALLQKHLPHDHIIDLAYLYRVASRCLLHGGQIRNVALLASLLALESRGRLQTAHLDQALRREYTKAGALYPLTNCRRSSRRSCQDAESLANALEVL